MKEDHVWGTVPHLIPSITSFPLAAMLKETPTHGGTGICYMCMKIIAVAPIERLNETHALCA